MDKELNLFCAILDLNIEEDLAGVAEVALAVKIILMTVMQFSTKMRFSRDNDFKTLTTSSKLTGSHSKIIGSSWSSEMSKSTSFSLLKCLSGTFNSSVTSCLPIAFKNNCSSWVNSLNSGWSSLSLMALTN